MSAINWDRYQRAVFAELSNGSGGHLVVQARAGSGKTSVIVEGLSYVNKYADTLLCAFNKSIARDLSGKAPRHARVQTLHSLGLAALSQRLGKKPEVDGEKGKRIARQVLAEHAAAVRKQSKGAARARKNRDPLHGYHYNLFRLAGMGKNTFAKSIKDLEDLAFTFKIEDDVFPAHLMAPLAAECMKRAAQDTSVVDFDDMLYLPAKHQLTPQSYSYVFVDECPDLNAAQLWLAKSACIAGGRIIAIGDPKQAIYAWRGADREAMPRIIEQLNAKVLPLSVTYRCAQSIVEYIKGIVPGLDDLECRPGAPEGEVRTFEWDQCMSPSGARPGDFILSRLNAPLMPVAMHFLTHGIPCTVAGKDIGRNLSTLARKSEAHTTNELHRWLIDYKGKEHERLAKADQLEHFADVNDRVEALLTIAEDCTTVDEVCARIEGMFSDETETGAIICSTVHKAKGLERERVFMLMNTFRPGHSEEEDNIYYVACTRSKTKLFLVHGPKDEDVPQMR